MAKEEKKKERWYKAIWDAYKFTRSQDKTLVPRLLITFFGINALGVAVGLILGNTLGLVYSIVTAFLLSTLGTLWTLTMRTERAAMLRLENTAGGSLSALQTIRTGWAFADMPIEIDPKTQSMIVRGIGRAGIALVAEGKGPTHKMMANARRKLSKIAPGAPIHEIYVGTGEHEVPLRKLNKTVKRLKKSLSRKEVEAVAARLHALQGSALPIPKGIDPNRMRSAGKPR